MDFVSEHAIGATVHLWGKLCRVVAVRFTQSTVSYDVLTSDGLKLADVHGTYFDEHTHASAAPKAYALS